MYFITFLNKQVTKTRDFLSVLEVNFAPNLFTVMCLCELPLKELCELPLK